MTIFASRTPTDGCRCCLKIYHIMPVLVTAAQFGDKREPS
jgi:hypothetical protein